MNQWQLHDGDKIFTARKYAGLTNNCFCFSPEVLQAIKKTAFAQQPLWRWASDYLLKKIFASGMCTGFSAWTLLDFLGKAPAGDKIQMAAVLQARVLLPAVWQPCLCDYGCLASQIIERIKESWNSDDLRQLGLLFIIPKVKNMTQIAHAHTMIPYKIVETNSSYQLFVYDSNDPYNANSIMTIDGSDSTWQYGMFNQAGWYLSYQPITTIVGNDFSV